MTVAVGGLPAAVSASIGAAAMCECPMCHRTMPAEDWRPDFERTGCWDCAADLLEVELAGGSA